MNQKSYTKPTWDPTWELRDKETKSQKVKETKRLREEEWQGGRERKTRGRERKIRGRLGKTMGRLRKTMGRLRKNYGKAKKNLRKGN